MAAKKSKPKLTAEAPAPRDRISGPEHRDGGVYFSERDLVTYELARARFENAVVMSEVLSHRIEKERREANERILSMRNDQLTNAKELERLRVEAAAVTQEINDKYGVDLTKVSYDDKTGKIHQLSEALNGTT